MARFTILLIGLLFFLHQDCWLWDADDLIAGFLPIGLAYHAAFSVAAGLVWALAVKTIWPAKWERWAEIEE